MVYFYDRWVSLPRLSHSNPIENAKFYYIQESLMGVPSSFGLVSFVQWHINLRGLFNAKAIVVEGQ